MQIQVVLQSPTLITDNFKYSEEWSEKIEAIARDPKLFALGNIFEVPSRYDAIFVTFVQTLIEALYMFRMAETPIPTWLEACKEDFQQDEINCNSGNIEP